MWFRSLRIFLQVFIGYQNTWTSRGVRSNFGYDNLWIINEFGKIISSSICILLDLTYCRLMLRKIISAALLKAWHSRWFILKIRTTKKIFGQQASGPPVEICLVRLWYLLYKSKTVPKIMTSFDYCSLTLGSSPLNDCPKYKYY